MQPTIGGINVFSPPLQYWQSQVQVAFPHILFVSNCAGFGQFLLISQLIQDPRCEFVPEDKVRPIQQFKFGDSPKADKCKKITFKCILDEVLNANTIYPYWFYQSENTILFRFMKEPMGGEKFTNPAKFMKANPEGLDVVVFKAIPFGKIMSKVELELGYYQLDSKNKKLIDAKIYFLNPYTPSDNQKKGLETIKYEFEFTFHPMTQGELVVAFALQWPVYLVLYIVIGCCSCFEILVFTYYHYLANRKVNK